MIPSYTNGEYIPWNIKILKIVLTSPAEIDLRQCADIEYLELVNVRSVLFHENIYTNLITLSIYNSLTKTNVKQFIGLKNLTVKTVKNKYILHFPPNIESLHLQDVSINCRDFPPSLKTLRLQKITRQNIHVSIDNYCGIENLYADNISNLIITNNNIKNIICRNSSVYYFRGNMCQDIDLDMHNSSYRPLLADDACCWTSSGSSHHP